MNCRVFYKPDETVVVVRVLGSSRRQLNLAEVNAAKEAAQVREQAQAKATALTQYATDVRARVETLVGKARGQAQAKAEKAEAEASDALATISPEVVIPAPIHETDQEYIDSAGARAVKKSQDKLDAEKAKPNPDPDKVAFLEDRLLVGLPFDDIDPATLPDKIDREKWRGSKGAGVSVDATVITLAERRKAKEDALDAELAKPSPDAVETARLSRDLDKQNY